MKFFRRTMISYKERLSVKFLCAMLAIVVMPLSVIMLIAYHITTKEYRQNFQVINQLYLEETVNTVEQVMLQVDGAYQQVAQRKDLREFETSYIGRQYEKGAWISSDRGPDLEHYFDLKKNTLYELSVLRNLSDWVNSVYLYDSDKGLVLTDAGVEYKLAEFYDREWLDFLKSSETIPYLTIMPTRSVQHEGQKKDVISMIYRSVTNTDNSYVMNIDASELFEHIIEMIPDKNWSSLVVMNDERQLIYASDMDTYYAERNLELPQSDGSVKFLMNEETGQTASGLRSKNLGWIFVTVTDAGRLYRELNHIVGLFFMIVFLVLAFVLVSVYAFMRRMYHPVLGIVEKLMGGSEFKGLDGAEQAVNHFFESRDYAQKWLEESKPVYRNYFISSLLQQHSPLNLKELRERMDFLDIEIDLKDLFVVVLNIRYDVFDGEVITYPAIMLQRVILEQCGVLLAREHKYVITQNAENEYVLLMNGGKGKEENLYRNIREFHLAVTSGLEGVDCTIGISDYCATVEDLPRAYESVKNLLKYNTFLKKTSIFIVGDTSERHSGVINYPSYDMKLLRSGVIGNRTDQAYESLSKIFKNLAKEKEQSSDGEIRYIILRMLTEILDIMAEAGSDFSYDSMEANIYDDISSCSDLDLIFSAFWAMIDRALAPKHSEEEKPNYYVERIIGMLEEDCGASVNLTILAERLGVSSAYISHLFKHYMNMTFMEYLTNVRMERAKKLLTVDHMKIKEVAEVLGYSNSDYFIRLFKQRIGVTPGVYKKMMK